LKGHDMETVLDDIRHELFDNLDMIDAGATIEDWKSVTYYLLELVDDAESFLKGE